MPIFVNFASFHLNGSKIFPDKKLFGKTDEKGEAFLWKIPNGVMLALNGARPLGNQQAGKHPYQLVQEHIGRGQQLQCAENR